MMVVPVDVLPTLIEDVAMLNTKENPQMERSKKSPPSRVGAKSKDDSWQVEKSLMMRASILEATLQCLVDLGYAQTTTEKIAKQAGVSRGAMTHHFKSREAVFVAAAEYIVDKRAHEYEKVISRVKVPLGSFPTLKNMRDAMSDLHQYYMTPT